VPRRAPRARTTGSVGARRSGGCGHIRRFETSRTVKSRFGRIAGVFVSPRHPSFDPRPQRLPPPSSWVEAITTFRAESAIPGSKRDDVSLKIFALDAVDADASHRDDARLRARRSARGFARLFAPSRVHASPSAGEKRPHADPIERLFAKKNNNERKQTRWPPSPSPPACASRGRTFLAQSSFEEATTSYHVGGTRARCDAGCSTTTA
jgi:hypothetical protein